MKRRDIAYWQNKLAQLRNDRAEGLDPTYCAQVRTVMLRLLDDIRANTHEKDWPPFRISLDDALTEPQP